MKAFVWGLRKLTHIPQHIINLVVLHLFYIFGVGLTSVISKLTGKHFLVKNVPTSTWKNRSLKPPLIEKMY